VDVEDFPPGGNFPVAISETLSRSDYYLLLWSQHAVDRPWVNAEWSAALVRDLQEREAFLFIARLDATPLPLILAPRRFFDATDDWDAFVAEVTSVWTRDCSRPELVLPTPAAPDGGGSLGAGEGGERGDPIADGQPLAEVYVYNRALRVSRPVAVPREVTGAGLWRQVRRALHLKESVSTFMNDAALTLRYELTSSGQQIPDAEDIGMRIQDGAVVELAILLELRAGRETVTTMQFRGESPPTHAGAGPGPAMDPRLIRALLDEALGHLTPW
jgi:hypothetical protein